MTRHCPERACPYMNLHSVLAAVLAATAFSASAQSPEPVPVLLISIDGFRADYLERGLTPTLARLANGGVTTRGMHPSFPSSTFPNHYTLVTGKVPDHHGLVNNTMRDPQRPGATFKLSDHAAVTDAFWYNDATPLWVSARQQGKIASTFFWPGSEAAIQGVRPNDWVKYDGAMPYRKRVDTVVSWLARPVGKRPDFATLYFEGVDSAGHEFGPDSPEVNQALKDVDQAIEQLEQGLAKHHQAGKVNLVIVADHGMAAVKPERAILLDLLAPEADMTLISYGAVAGIDPKPGKEASVTAALTVPLHHGQCWTKATIPAKLNYGSHARVPAIVCAADNGWFFTTRKKLADNGANRGMHGYDPANRDMDALFVANGPAFKPGVTLPPFNNVDVYALLARLSGVRPEANDGDPATFLPALADQH